MIGRWGWIPRNWLESLFEDKGEHFFGIPCFSIQSDPFMSTVVRHV